LKPQTLLAIAALLTGCGGGVGPSPAPSLAESACRAAVAAQTRDGRVTIAGSRGDGARSSVRIDVPGSRATWSCIATAEGDVLSVIPG